MTDSRGRDVAKLLRPRKTDYFVLKPKHSGFFSTTLDILLELPGREDGDPDRHRGEHLRAVHRERRVHARPDAGGPGDCVASNTEELNDYALAADGDVLKADIRESGELSNDVLSQLRSSGAFNV